MESHQKARLQISESDPTGYTPHPEDRHVWTMRRAIESAGGLAAFWNLTGDPASSIDPDWALAWEHASREAGYPDGE